MNYKLKGDSLTDRTSMALRKTVAGIIRRSTRFPKNRSNAEAKTCTMPENLKELEHFHLL